MDFMTTWFYDLTKFVHSFTHMQTHTHKHSQRQKTVSELIPRSSETAFQRERLRRSRAKHSLVGSIIRCVWCSGYVHHDVLSMMVLLLENSHSLGICNGTAAAAFIGWARSFEMKGLVRHHRRCRRRRRRRALALKHVYIAYMHLYYIMENTNVQHVARTRTRTWAK